MDASRRCAFWLRARLTVLPAFSRFTGGLALGQTDGESLVVCVEGALIALPEARGASGRR